MDRRNIIANNLSFFWLFLVPNHKVQQSLQATFYQKVHQIQNFINKYK